MSSTKRARVDEADLTEGSEITDASSVLYRIPLPERLEDAKHGVHTHFELIVVKLFTRDGFVGVGYTYTGGTGGTAIRDMVLRDLKHVLVGKDSLQIEQLYHKMHWHTHYVGRGGIAGFAISAIDIALWDLKCKRLKVPLWLLAGGFQRQVRCYAGGIDLHMTVPALRANVRAYIDQGHTAVKIKLGKPTVKEDIARVAAVREEIGPDISLMVDANMGWTVAVAVAAAKELAKLNVLWLEEPTIPDDYEGFHRVGERGGIAVAGGENMHLLAEFAHALKAGALDYPQPDASNIGGCTGWLKVAALCEAHNLPVCSHGMQELHVSLLAAVPNPGWMEVHSFPIDKYTVAGAVEAVNGYATAPDTPGTGVVFDWVALEPFVESELS